MKTYAQMKLQFRYCSIDGTHKVNEVLLENENFKIIDGKIYFVSKRSDGQIINIPFICEISDYQYSPLDLLKAIAMNVDLSYRYKVKDIFESGKTYLHYDKLMTDHDVRVYKSGKSNLGNYIGIAHFLEAAEIKELIKDWTVEEVTAYKKGIEEFEGIVRDTYNNLYCESMNSKMERTRNIKNDEIFIKNFPKNIAK